MLFFELGKNKDRRSHKERRVPNSAHYIGPEHRHYERRKNKDRKQNPDRRSGGLYHRLSEQRKTTLDGILNRLEDLLDEER